MPFNQKSLLSRRKMLKLTGTAALGTALFGCHGGSDGQNTISFISALTKEKHRALEPLIAEFSDMHPDITIDHIKVPWDQAHSKFLTMIIGGNPPDLMSIPSQWLAEFRARGALENLKPWFQDWPHKDGYPETVELMSRSATAFDGEDVYGLPFEIAVRAMFYRKEWLDEQGLVPATTRMEWRTLLEKMTDKEKQRYGYAFRGARGGFYSWWALVEEFAGTNAWFDEHHQCIINRPDHVAGISFWNDLYQDGLTPKDSLNWGYNELVQGFWSGICGSMEQDPEVVRTCLEHGLDENTLSISIMPAGPKARVSLADLGYVSMASGSQRKDKAWEFLSWLMAPEQRLRYCKDVNMIPPFTESINDPAFGQGLYQPFMDMVTDRTMLPNWYPNYLPEMGEFLEVRVTEEHQNMLLKNQSPQETMDRLADFMTKAQKKYVDKHGPDTPRPPEIRRR
jgi:multiple sugar transport system substrate-binding protein